MQHKCVISGNQTCSFAIIHKLSLSHDRYIQVWLTIWYHHHAATQPVLTWLVAQLYDIYCTTQPR